MNGYSLPILCGVVILTGLLVPAVHAVDPLWTQAATTSGELSCLVISQDGSTVVAGGDQLIALSRDGRKLWSAWSGTYLAISSDGNYILSSRDQNVRMLSGSGTMLWDTSLGVPVTDMTMTPDASLIAAGGGNRVRLISTSGDGIRQNTSIPVNHLRIFPGGDRVVIATKNGVQTSNLTLYADWTDTNMTQDLVEVSADGSSFVTVTNNRIRLYTRDGRLQWDRALPGGNALGFAYSRDGSTIVVGRDDNTVSVLDRSGALLWTERASYWITSVAVSDDGNTIAAGSMDKSLSVYDRAGTKLGSFTAKNPIKARSVAVSGDGSVIAAVDESAVYGFSRSQFTEPAATAVTSSRAAVTTPAPATTYPVTPSPAVIPLATTTQAAVPPGIPLIALALFFLCRSRFT
ncbi:MAG: WD40 repeat domain-containing protein [Methanoregula sp.]